MSRVLRGLAVLSACCLPVLMLATPSQATSGTPRTTHRLTATQARAMRERVTSGTAASTTRVLDFCHAHKLRCQASVLASSGSSVPLSAFTPFGFGAKDLESAYGVSGTRRQGRHHRDRGRRRLPHDRE